MKRLLICSFVSKFVYRYIYSACQITKVMKESFNDSRAESPNQDLKNNSINQSLLLIKKFAIEYVVLILLWIVSLLIGSIQYQSTYKRAWINNEAPYYMLLIDIAFIFAIAAILALVKYIHDASIKATSKSKTQANEENINKSTSKPSGGVVVPTPNLER